MLFADADAADWEAALPEGAEKDLVALNRAKGDLEGADYVGTQSKVQLKTEMEPYSLRGIRPKAAGFAGIFSVSAAELPPELTTTFQLSFYLMKKGKTYYLLTPKNFARLFAPLTDKNEVLPLVAAYEQLFGNSSPQIIGPNYKWKNRDDDFTGPKEAPPARSSVAKTKAGFDVRLIVYNGLHHAYYAEKRLLVSTDGSIEETQKLKVIKDLGLGYVE